MKYILHLFVGLFHSCPFLLYSGKGWRLGDLIWVYPWLKPIVPSLFVIYNTFSVSMQTMIQNIVLEPLFRNFDYVNNESGITEISCYESCISFSFLHVSKGTCFLLFLEIQSGCLFRTLFAIVTG